MDQREYILNKLKSYVTIYPEEERHRLAMISFIQKNPECFDRSFKLGHLCGGALVVDKSLTYTLLTHHMKLDKWFQFGGHAEGNPNPFEVALKEAQEESGLKSLEYLQEPETIFDIDIHPIPEHNDMPMHLHYEVRIILTADINEPFTVSSESKDLKWVKLNEVHMYNSQPAFLRLIQKVITLSQI